MRKRSEIKKPVSELPRNPDGFINNCALHLGLNEGEDDCQMCKGTCPDKPRLIALGLYSGDNRRKIVDTVSAQLNETIKNALDEDDNTRREAIRKSGSHPASWPSANRPKEKPIDDRFGRIIETVFVDDVEDTYKRLEEQLRVGEERSDRGILTRALDNAHTNARLAHRLWMTAKLEQQRYEITNKIIFGALREEASRVLQREKDQKLRSKQITEEDLEHEAALLYPDEFESQRIRRTKAELMVKSMENLAEMWNKRCSALEVMCGKSR